MGNGDVRQPSPLRCWEGGFLITTLRYLLFETILNAFKTYNKCCIINDQRLIIEAQKKLFRKVHIWQPSGGARMKLKVIIHEAEEGGYWAEVPSIPGCATQGESFDELLSNIYEAVDACLSVDLKDIPVTENDRVLEIAV